MSRNKTLNELRLRMEDGGRRSDGGGRKERRNWEDGKIGKTEVGSRKSEIGRKRRTQIRPGEQVLQISQIKEKHKTEEDTNGIAMPSAFHKLHKYKNEILGVHFVQTQISQISRMKTEDGKRHTDSTDCADENRGRKKTQIPQIAQMKTENRNRHKWHSHAFGIPQITHI